MRMAPQAVNKKADITAHKRLLSPERLLGEGMGEEASLSPMILVVGRDDVVFALLSVKRGVIAGVFGKLVLPAAFVSVYLRYMVGVISRGIFVISIVIIAR